MANKLDRFGGTDWEDDDVLDAADLVQSIGVASNGWNKLHYDSTFGSGLIKFSANNWSTNSKRTTDGGDTWTSPGWGNFSTAHASGAQGIAISESNGNTAFSTNSGASWSASSTTPPTITTGNGVHLWSTTIGICVGIAGSNSGIWYTTNGGDDWTQSAGAGIGFNACVMASATVGYAIDTGASIWKTTDGGVNWTDTNDDIIDGSGQRMYAIDTDTLLILGTGYTGNPILQHYVNSTSTVTTLFTSENMDGTMSNIVKANNGFFYFAQLNITGRDIILYKWDGTNLFDKTVGLSSGSGAPAHWITNECSINVLIEGADNVLWFSNNDFFKEINVTE